MNWCGCRRLRCCSSGEPEAENRSLGGGFVARLLDEALAHTGLTDPAGEPLHFTAHDFRRMFITDAVLNGLPPHIAQVIAGHRDISVTMGYKAVYPDEAITAHLAFIARRRALRPTEEYRQPTDEEWQQFLGHFERRKVSVGTCGRAFRTPCIHEHACVRCALLWPDPQQRSQLQEIRDNLKPASPKPNVKAGSARSMDSRSASRVPRTNSPRSKDAAGQPLTSLTPTSASQASGEPINSNRTTVRFGEPPVAATWGPGSCAGAVRRNLGWRKRGATSYNKPAFFIKSVTFCASSVEGSTAGACSWSSGGGLNSAERHCRLVADEAFGETKPVGTAVRRINKSPGRLRLTPPRCVPG